MWFDSHCHISAGDFEADRAQVMERATESGVEGFVAIGSGYGIPHNARAVALAECDPRVFATVGVHPHEAQTLDDAGRQALEALLGHPRVVAVGEAGLDYHYMNSPREIQREVFAEQVASARARDLPVSVHVRGDEPDAFGEMLDIWRAEGRGAVRGVLHCYTGTLEFATIALDAGFYISFSGILTFKNDRGLREVAAALPLERLMVETDAPLLAPEGFRGRRNEPAHVARVGEALARTKGLAPEAVARATTHNARDLFRIGEAV
ncbi:MAG TPA: TatD family hydrolase [Myxococcota bacterium]